MAKSIGNVVDVAEAVERHGSNAIRMWLLQATTAAHRLLRRDTGGESALYERLTRLYRQIAGSTDSSELSDRLAAELLERFDAAMRDDLNTPEAIAAVFESPAGRGRRSPPAPRPLASSPRYRGSPGGPDDLRFDLAEELAADVDGVRVRYSEEPGKRSAPGRRQGACAAREGLAGRRQVARRAGQRGLGGRRYPRRSHPQPPVAVPRDHLRRPPCDRGAARRAPEVSEVLDSTGNAEVAQAASGRRAREEISQARVESRPPEEYRGGGAGGPYPYVDLEDLLAASDPFVVVSTATRTTLGAVRGSPRAGSERRRHPEGQGRGRHGRRQGERGR